MTSPSARISTPSITSPAAARFLRSNRGMPDDRPPFQVLALDHVVLRVRDMDVAIAFYAGVLGCALEWRRDELGLAHLRAGRALIDLVAIGGPLGRNGGDDGTPGGHGRNVDHLCLRVDPFDGPAIAAHVTARGHPAPEPPRSRYGAEGHGPSLYLRDPDGNTVELKGAAETSSPGPRDAGAAPDPTAVAGTTLAPLSRYNWLSAARLALGDGQQGLVAENVWSLAEAGVEPHYRPRLINLYGQPRGFLMYCVEVDPPDPTLYWLFRFMVDASHQGRGIGRSALALAVAEMRALGATRVRTMVKPQNTRAMRLYERAGFTRIGTLDDGDIELERTLQPMPVP